MNKIKEVITTNRVKSVLIGLVVVLVGVTLIRTGGIFGSISWLRNSSDTEYLSDKSVEGLEFKNASMEYENGITTYIVEVHNESNSEYNLKNIDINITNENDEVVVLYGYIGNKIDAGSMKVITASIDQELSSTTKIEYVINR